MGKAYSKALDVDNVGGIYLAGFMDDNTHLDSLTLNLTGYRNIFMAKYSETGTLKWAKKDGTSYDASCDMCLDGKGNLFVTGSKATQSVFSGTLTTHAGFYLAKYDSLGNGLWLKESVNTDMGEGVAVCVDTSGSCFVMGDFSDTLRFNASPDVSVVGPQLYLNSFIVKYNKYGAPMWATAPVNSNGHSNNGNTMCYDIWNNCVYTGRYDGSLSFGNNIGLPNTTQSGHIFMAKLKDTLLPIVTHIANNSSSQEPMIFPNPSNGEYFIKYGDGVLSWKLLNVTGDILKQEENTITIDVSAFMKGVYFVEIKNNGNTSRHKIFKE